MPYKKKHKEGTIEDTADSILEELEENKKPKKKSTKTKKKKPRDSSSEESSTDEDDGDTSVESGSSASKRDKTKEACKLVLGVLSDSKYSPEKLTKKIKKVNEKHKAWISCLKEDQALSIVEACVVKRTPICAVASDVALGVLDRISNQAKLNAIYEKTINARKDIEIENREEIPQNFAEALDRVFFVGHEPANTEMYLDLWKRFFAQPHPFIQRLLEAYVIYDITVFRKEATTDRIVFIRLMMKYLSDKIKARAEFLNCDDLEQNASIFPKFLESCLEFASDETEILQRAVSDLLRLVLGALKKPGGQPTRSVRICGEIATVLLDEHFNGRGRSKVFYRKLKQSCMGDIVDLLTLMFPPGGEALAEDTVSTLTSATFVRKSSHHDSGNESESVRVMGDNSKLWKLDLQRQLEDSVFETGANYCTPEMSPFVTKIIEHYKDSQGSRWIEFVQKLYHSSRQNVDPYLPMFFSTLSRARVNDDYLMTRSILDLILCVANESAYSFKDDQLKTIENLCLTYNPDLSSKAWNVLEVLSQNNAALFKGKGKGYFAAGRFCSPETQLQTVNILANIAGQSKEEAGRVIELIEKEMLPSNNKTLIEAILKAWKRIAVVYPDLVTSQCSDRLKEYENDPVLRPSAQEITRAMTSSKSAACSVM